MMVPKKIDHLRSMDKVGVNSFMKGLIVQFPGNIAYDQTLFCLLAAQNKMTMTHDP